MNGIVRKLRDGEIEALARYISGARAMESAEKLPGESVQLPRMATGGYGGGIVENGGTKTR
jgi:hypothetical protein